MRNIEHDLPGFLGLASDLQARIDAVGEGDIPTEWTPEHVANRMVEAFDILSRSGGRVGPGKFGNAWPEMLIEFADRTDAQARALAEKEWQQSRAAVPSSDEISRMNEALGWPMDHLDGKVIAADALMLWAYAKATGRDMDGMLHQRKKRATALASEMMRRANADPHAGDCRSIADQWRAALRAQLARGAMAALDIRLAASPKDQHDGIMKAATGAFNALCTRMNCQPYRYRPRDAMPGRVMTRTWLDVNRKIAAAAIASGLRQRGVPVR